jgi:Iap family predicted aminopeptidase
MTNASTSTINTVTTSNTTNPNNPSTSAVDTATDVANPTSAVDPATDVANSTSEWNEQTIRFLINQRKHRNREYYQIIGRSRKDYWASIARRINREANTQFTGCQCRRKFHKLVSHYYVSKLVC